MTTFNYLDLLRLVLPEVIVVIAALSVLSVDLVFLRASEKGLRGSVGAILSLIGCVVAVAWILHAPQSANVLDGMLVLNPLAQRVQIALLVLTMLMTCRYAAWLVGLNPARNWLVLLIPLPNESAPGAACGQLVQPKYCSCQAWYGVTTVMRLPCNWV